MLDYDRDSLHKHPPFGRLRRADTLAQDDEWRGVQLL